MAAHRLVAAGTCIALLELPRGEQLLVLDPDWAEPLALAAQSGARLTWSGQTGFQPSDLCGFEADAA